MLELWACESDNYVVWEKKNKQLLVSTTCKMEQVRDLTKMLRRFCNPYFLYFLCLSLYESCLINGLWTRVCLLFKLWLTYLCFSKTWINRGGTKMRGIVQGSIQVNFNEGMLLTLQPGCQSFFKQFTLVATTNHLICFNLILCISISTS